MKFFLLLNRARSAVLRRQNRVVRAELGVSVLELAALWSLGGDGVGVGELGRRLDIDKAAASRLADQLVRKGLAARHSDPEDGRRKRLRRTDEAVPIAARGSALVEQANRRLRQTFSEEELQITASVLQRLLTELEDE